MTTTRTCVGCQAAEDPAGMVRLLLGPEGELVVDSRGGNGGRGAWVHPRPECLTRAVPKGVSRTLKASVRTRVDELAEKIRAAGVRRLAGLLSAARGAKQIAVGASAVEEAVASGAVRLLLVASDARAAVSSHAVSELIAAGRAVALLDKAELGALVGRDEAGVVAILEAGFAASIRDAAVLSSFAMPRGSADRRVVATEAP